MIISLLKKPLNGGIPEIDIDATKDVADVAGIDFASPPISLRLRVPIVYSIAPALRNKRLLKAAWLTRWKIPPATASVAIFGVTPLERRIIPIPTDITT